MNKNIRAWTVSYTHLSVVPTRWNYNSRLVATIIEHKADIISLFESMTENGVKWDNESYTGAIGLSLIHI